jgi:DNA-binding beta-propeller fold protein YncE
MFDQLDLEMKYSLDQKDRLDSSKLELVNKQCDVLASDIRTLRSHLNNAKPSERFVVMKKSKNYIPVIKEGISKVSNDNDIQDYEFEASKEVAEMKKNVTTLGLLLLQSSKIKRNTEFRASINIKGSLERQCDAYGLCLVNENTLVVCDHYNMCLKVVDTNKNCVLSVFALSAQPNDVTTINEEKIATTLQTDKKIKILAISHIGALSNEGEITVDGLCQGITYSEGNLFVTYDKPDSKVQIMDMNGRVFRTFKNNANGGALFYRPWNIAVSPDQANIYISDYGNSTVTCMTLDGKVIACYWDKELKGPKGLAVDKEGSVYVCGADSNNIHQLSSNCTKIQVLLHRFHGIQGNTCIAYCTKTNRLYVEWYNRNEIKVYELK